MSHIIKLNLSLILAILGCAGAIFTSVAAITRRDHDVVELKSSFGEMKAEFRSLRDTASKDREALIGIQRDLQWLIEQKKTVQK